MKLATIWTLGLGMLLLLGGATSRSAHTAAAAMQDLPDEIERADLFTFARGVLFVRQTGLSTGSTDTALRVIDGDAYRMGLTVDRAGPVEFIYKLPADTTFDRFAIPNVEETPGNVTFVKSVMVSGSLEGPDGGYQTLASFELETHGPDETVTELTPDVVTPVRWIKINFAGAINIEPGHEGRTAIRFSELIGNGTQEARPLSTAFDGVWDLRLTERTDLRGQPLELHQDGTTISGCHGFVELLGTVNGAIARATGVDTRNDRPSAYIFVADEDGTIHGNVAVNRGRFSPRTAVVDPETTSAPCSDAPPEPVACGANVYVNFDVDSAVILPESEQVLADLFERLVSEDARRVSVAGHTSTEGSVEYNLSLSERRAQAVVDDLLMRGFAEANISAVGKGESEPLISPDRDESARALNRRVQIACDEAAVN